MQPKAIQPPWCLRNLQTQVVGTVLSELYDRQVIEQVSASQVGESPVGQTLRCRIGDCAARCVLVNEAGILYEVSQSGDAVCEQ